MIAGWGVAQNPYLLPQKLTVTQAAAPSATLTTVLIIFGVAVVLVLPSIGLLFTLVHFNKDWLTVGLTPVVLGAGLLLGMIAWASRSLIFCILGHTLMDIGLFAYWWTQIAGVFTARPIFETGVDAPFWLACGILLLALAISLWAIRRLAAQRDPA